MPETSFSVGLPRPAIVYAHYVVPTTLMRGLAAAKPIRQTHPRCPRVFENARYRKLGFREHLF